MIKRYALLVFILVLVITLARLPKAPKAPFNLKAFGSIPVLHEGRIKPFNSAVTAIAMMIYEKQYIRSDQGKLHPTEWALLMMTSPDKANRIPVFLVDHPHIKSMISEKKSKWFSLDEIHSVLSTIYEQSAEAVKVDSHHRNTYQRDIIQLQQKLDVYFQLQSSLFVPTETGYQSDIETFTKSIPIVLPILSQENPALSGPEQQALSSFIEIFQSYKRITDSSLLLVVPHPHSPTDASLWESTGAHVLRQVQEDHPLSPVVPYLAKLFDAYAQNHPSVFNQAVSQFSLAKFYGKKLQYRVLAEHYFTLAQPFFVSLVLYLIGALVLFLSFIKLPSFFDLLSKYCLQSAFFLHTLGLGLRLYISGRPPVTNLYSSAVFVGWIAIILALLLERRFKNKVGSLVACMIGFSTLIIAHHLAFQGDTMSMMQAVLDSNFWLSTHVVTITMGYSGVFLSGFIGIIFILKGIYTTKLTAELQSQLKSMVFGILCFSLFFSFIGTVLGGIWADQSWGRFWGWDPKENGALLIVIWLAIVLHARIGGFIQTRGLMIMSIFGNIVTAFSWFGVNMLGIGLHSYGFMDKAFMWLIVFIVSQLFIMGLGLLPKYYWKSKIIK